MIHRFFFQLNIDWMLMITMISLFDLDYSKD